MQNISSSRLGLLARRFPAGGSDFIYVQPFQGAGSLATDYQQAAHRLAETFVGSEIDDAILKQYLLLYRHAFELQLKSILIEWQFAKAKMSGLAPPAFDDLERNLQDEHGHKLLRLYKHVIQEFNTVFPQGLTPPRI